MTTPSLGRPLRTQKKLRAEDSRRHHTALLLQRLFSDGPASRADLARTTGLTRVTVSDLVRELVAEGRVEELGAPTQSRVGKPPILVGLAEDSAHIISIDLSGDEDVTGAVLNLSGTVQVRRALPRQDRTGEAVISLLVQLAEALIGLTARPILGVGVGSPGVIDAGGSVIDAPNLAWHGIPVARRLSDHLGLPVYLANDANTAALGEHTFGDTGEGGLMVLRIGTGVGAGVIVGGSLLHGNHAAAGEIGHVTVDPGGLACACTRRGCLETVLATPHLRRALSDLEMQAPNAAPKPAERDHLLTQVGDTLGHTLAPVVGVLNLREVVLSGPTDLLDGPLLDATDRTIRETTMPVSGEGLTVRASSLGEDIVLKGAAVLVLAGVLGVS